MKINFLNKNKGAALVEYGILVGLIGIVGIVSVVGVGESVNATFGSLNSTTQNTFTQSVIGANDDNTNPPAGGGDPAAGGGEPVLDIDCYDPASVGLVGNAGVCNGMLILDNLMLSDASFPDSWYEILGPDGVTYDFGNNDFNVFTGQVTDMSFLFAQGGGQQFNSPGDIGYWETSNVTNMEAMFESMNFFGFGPNIESWNMFNVTNMSRMFQFSDFNQDISGWNVSGVTNGSGMVRMFDGAGSFNQDLSGWCVDSISAKPFNFDRNTFDWALPQPVWGTCPGP